MVLEDLDIVYDAKGRQQQRSRRRGLKRKGHDPPDPTVIPPAFLLTSQVAADLAAGLDASDILECYWLTRRVFLQGVANQTISVSKTALGLRYRPPPWDASADSSNVHKREIVLEYGPDRAGSKAENDVLPVVIENADTLESYVSWHNQAKVYYSQEIHALQYESATYMASVTGAVVADVLQEAAQYPSKRGSRRYQPWQVMLVNENPAHETEETAVVKLRSSSDVDFVTQLLHHLAVLGVDLLPVLRPTVYALELLTSQVSRRTVTPTTKGEMATFYQNLYACVNQLAAGKPASRTAATTTNYPLLATTMAPTASTSMAPVPSTITLAPSYGLDVADAKPTDVPTLPPRRRILEEADDNKTDTTITTMAPSIAAVPPTPSPTLVKTEQPTELVPPTRADPPPSSSAADAQKAAEEAHKAAQNATDIESATQAAQQAVDAAQQAVDATVFQEALLRQEALLSGNGEEMALTLSLCFSDPIYGIRSSATGSTANATKAFLYWDASYYFDLELVHPYIRVVTTTWTPPQIQKPTVSAFSPDSSLVDFSLAMVILGFSILGILLLIQRVSPSSSWRSAWLYKYQRWFFDPMHHNYDEEENEEVRRRSESRPLGGIQQPAEGIPYSMGGGGGGIAQRPSPLYVGGHFRKTRGASKDVLFRHSSSGASDTGGLGGDNGSVSGAGGDVEMIAQQKSVGSLNANDDAFSDVGDDDFMDETSVVSHRLFRDPELVEMPDLTSSSKVAVPVSLKRSTSGNFSIE